MAVQVIDTLKPKNNGDFPVAEAADIAVSAEQRLPEALAAKAEASALAETNAVVAGKANTTDVNTATANLQGQINQIEITASAEGVVAPEVAAARVDEAGNEFTTLKARIDADANRSDTGIGIINSDTEQFLYVKHPYDRQLFDARTMIPATPLKLTVQQSTQKVVANDGYRMYIIEVNGLQGDSFSYNFLNNGTEVTGYTASYICATNKLPEVDDIVQWGNNSPTNMRGVITLSSNAKYLLISINTSAASASDEAAYTAACNALMEHIVVRKGEDYDTTYYHYAEYADYVLMLGEDNLSPSVKANINSKAAQSEVDRIESDIDTIGEDTEKYLYIKKPYDRQLFDISTMIPAEPIELTVRTSTHILVASSGYRMYIVEINGSQGDSFSYNFLNNGTDVEGFSVCYICATDKLPEAGDLVQYGNNSPSNMRGWITLDSAHKYLIFSVGSTAAYSPESEYTAACNELMAHIVVRKGADYDNTYYSYDEYADYVFSSTDEQAVKEIINETVPAWAMGETPPTYTAEDVNAVSLIQGSQNDGKVLVVGSDGVVTLGEGPDLNPNAAVRYYPTTTFNVGENLIDNQTEVTLGSNWSGDLENGFTHTSGAVDEMVVELATEYGSSYYIDFDVSTQTADLLVTIGDEPYVDPYNGENHYNIGIVSDGGKLKLKAANTSLAVTITNLKLRKIGVTGTAITLSEKNVDAGVNVSNITGFWNVAIGSDTTQAANQNGSRNIAIGSNAQFKLKSGTRNVSIGTFAMPFVTEGDRNIAIGADTLYTTTQYTKSVAYDNVAIGKATMANGQLIVGNVAIGSKAMSQNDANATGNVAVGYQAGFYAHNRSTHIGYNAGYYTKGNNNVSVGYNSGTATYVTGDDNVCIGYNSGFNVSGAAASDIKTVNNSIAIGAGVKATASNQAVIGNSTQSLILCGKRIVFNNDGTVTWESL